MKRNLHKLLKQAMQCKVLVFRQPVDLLEEGPTSTIKLQSENWMENSEELEEEK